MAARARLAPLTAEVAGYIVWLVAAEALTDSRGVSAERIGVTAAGDVTLAAGGAEPALEGERELRRLLADLLALCQSSTPALQRASQRAASGDLEALQRELGAALIPINHAASRRALARLYRETDRARVELVAPVVIVEEEDSPRSTATATLPSPGPVPSLLEPGWEAPTSAVLHHCDTLPSAAVALAPELEPRAEVTEHQAFGEASPPWLAVEARDAPRGSACELQADSEAPATVGTTLRSVVGDELLEIEVQFARDTERPAPRWPSEWHVDSPALPELVPAPIAAAAWLGELELSEDTTGGAEAQTLRVSTPAESGVTDRHRSDLGQLLSRFLSESGSDERITKDLRRSMGLELEAERLSEDERTRAVGS